MKFNEMVTLDTECYINYFLAMFRSVADDRTLEFEKLNDSELNRKNILHLINKYTIVSFNGIKYDEVMLAAACQGFNNATMKKINDFLIVGKDGNGNQPWEARKQFGIGQLHFSHIDLINVAPLKANLKLYGGRMHTKKMQDMPTHPDDVIEDEDAEPMRKYCGNDLNITKELLFILREELELREFLSEDFNIELMSKSDPQIAEAIMKSQMALKYNVNIKKPTFKAGTRFYYNAPSNLIFKTDVMQDALKQYTENPFVVSNSGKVDFDFRIEESDRIKSGKNKGKFPEHKRKLKIQIGESKYTIGTGGLHSCEKSVSHVADGFIIREYDAKAFYPYIILNNNLYPEHIGPDFLRVYRDLVDRRMVAKANKQDIINESLKIVINGLFGKLGDPWSCVYAPHLMMQVTITGQLTLLMLIEQFELNGITVISANTDGIVVKMPHEREATAERLVSDWEFNTGYVMEGTDYTSLNSRSVSDYIAVKPDGTTKGKGMYADQSEPYYRLRKNPTTMICIEAVKSYLTDDIPIAKSILRCKDITKFTSIRTVNGGALKDGIEIGKSIRWYYGASEMDAIYYKTSGNRVPKSDGAVPLMDLPDTFPNDVDLPWYIKEANTMLAKIGVN